MELRLWVHGLAYDGAKLRSQCHEDPVRLYKECRSPVDAGHDGGMYLDTLLLILCGSILQHSHKPKP